MYLFTKGRLNQSLAKDFTNTTHTHKMTLRTWVSFAALGLLASAAFACNTLGECPSLELTNLAGNYTNYSYTADWTIAKRQGAPTADDTSNCRDTRTNADGTWSATCTWTVNCSAYNGSVVFRKFHVALREGSTIQVTNFSIWNYNVLASPLISISNLFVPRDSYSPREYTYAPDTLITGGSDHNAEVSLTVTSTNPAPRVDYEIDVHLNFTCSRIYRYVYVELSPDLPSDGGFWSIFAAYILPGIITAIIIIIALLRYCNPDLTIRLKKWAGFKELDDEARTRHAKIKDRAGGGTWHDHAAEVVSDLRTNHKVEQLQARNELDETDSDEELATFSPASKTPRGASKTPAQPTKEQSGDSIDLDLDDDDAPPKAKGAAGARATVKSSDDDLDFSDESDDDGLKASESDDDIL